MGRKSKQAGSGHLPLTNHEIKTYNKDGAYGTTTARFSASSQMNFGDCSLSLSPAIDQPVCTPSGYIYERPAILTYLLTKTQELKQQKFEHEQYKVEQDQAKERVAEKKRAADVAEFEASNTAVQDSTILSKKKKRKSESSTSNSLKTTSYWLADSQPVEKFAGGRAPGGGKGTGDEDVDTELALVVRRGSQGDRSSSPPQRPPSPNSGQPLRRKDLIDLQLKRNSDGQAICAVSEKSITSQRAVALVTTKNSSGDKKNGAAHVILKQVYDDLSIGQEKVCPVTGKKILKVVKLQKGGSSFATDDGKVEAKQYRPTMT
mmetsp:Transcript_39592/g.95640  ORF Transcript_39592/g.95640 Transcript_39592/m.95640 type:complete len:318 (+) Transcript_39592:83-1036(+)